jgi:FAD/FMN-containing dehydrogenase
LWLTKFFSKKLNGLLEELMESSAISDGVLAQDETQLQSLWSVRESIAEAAGKMGSVFKYDVSMPVDKMNELVEDMRKRFNDKGMLGEDKQVKEVVGYGHIGDGNLHINIIAESYSQEVESVIEPYIYEWIAKVNGSISAEHGLGRMKGEKIGYSKSPASIALMKDIKHLFDPDNILNPYKVRLKEFYVDFLELTLTSACSTSPLKSRLYTYDRNVHIHSSSASSRKRWARRDETSYYAP